MKFVFIYSYKLRLSYFSMEYSGSSFEKPVRTEWRWVACLLQTYMWFPQIVSTASSLQSRFPLRETESHEEERIYILLFELECVCVCVCLCERGREENYNFDRMPLVVSKILCQWHFTCRAWSITTSLCFRNMFLHVSRKYQCILWQSITNHFLNYIIYAERCNGKWDRQVLVVAISDKHFKLHILLIDQIQILPMGDILCRK